MSKRIKTRVKSLKWVNLLEGDPHWLRKRNVKGVQKAGLVFEERVGSYLRDWLGPERVLAGPWFEYEDADGKAWCQPDFVLLPEEGEPMVLVEVKLSYRTAVKSKLLRLYEPVVKRIWKPERGFPIKHVQVCKNLVKGFSEELIERRDLYGKDFKYAIWHLRKIL